MKYLAVIAALALVSESNALQLQDDLALPEEEDLFLQLSQETLKGNGKQMNGDWGDLATHSWGPLVPKKNPLEYTDGIRENHSATVQGHLSNQVFNHYHNSADELNDVITSAKGENKHDGEYN